MSSFLEQKFVKRALRTCAILLSTKSLKKRSPSKDNEFILATNFLFPSRISEEVFRRENTSFLYFSVFLFAFGRLF